MLGSEPMSITFKATGTIAKAPVEVEVKVSRVPSLIIKAKTLVSEVERLFDSNIPSQIALDFEIFEYANNMALVFDYRSGKYAWIPWRNDDESPHDLIRNVASGGIHLHPSIHLSDYDWQPMSKVELGKWITFFSKYPTKREFVAVMQMLWDELP
jgi:hypothetical protein